MSGHQPVLVEEVLHWLKPRPGEIVLDGTVGLGGHAARILPSLTPGGRYIGLDLDADMLAGAEQALAGAGGDVRCDLRHSSYADFPAVLREFDLEQVDVMLLDLGINSAQLDDPARGFSFDRDGPLDMRFDQQQRNSALDLVNQLEESQLADLIYQFGQDGQSRRIAREICRARRDRRISTTRELASIVARALDAGGRTNPATRVFQALRIAVNRELENLTSFLEAAPRYLRAGGRIGVIAFHSLEDGEVKRAFREGRRAGVYRELTRRPVGPQPAEQRTNPRARSAKLRVAERLAEDS